MQVSALRGIDWMGAPPKSKSWLSQYLGGKQKFTLLTRSTHWTFRRREVIVSTVNPPIQIKIQSSSHTDIFMSRFSLQPTFDTLQCGKPRFASPLLSGVVCHSGERGEGSQMFVRRGPPRSPSPYPFIYYLACEQAKCKPARIGKGEGDPFLAILFTLSAYREPVHRL